MTDTQTEEVPYVPQIADVEFEEVRQFYNLVPKDHPNMWDHVCYFDEEGPTLRRPDGTELTREVQEYITENKLVVTNHPTMDLRARFGEHEAVYAESLATAPIPYGAGMELADTPGHIAIERWKSGENAVGPRWERYALIDIHDNAHWLPPIVYPEDT